MIQSTDRSIRNYVAVMPIPFSCPYCKAQTIVDDEYAGETGPCYACNRDVTVPFPITGQGSSPDGAPAESNDENASENSSSESSSNESSQPTPSRTTSSRTLVMPILVASSVALLSLTCIIFAGVFVYYSGPSLGMVSESVTKTQCETNLQAIHKALLAYHDDYGSFPPAYTVNKSGQRLHSWRVLILPYLGYKDMYQHLDLDQPWDGQQNVWYFQSMPLEYACPGDPDAAMGVETRYVAVVGGQTMFPGAKTVTRSDVADDPKTTLMLVETAGMAIHWMEPRDLELSQTALTINAVSGDGIGSYHNGGAYILTADGKPHWMRESTPDEYLNSMSTINGGEQIPSDALVD